MTGYEDYGQRTWSRLAWLGIEAEQTVLKRKLDVLSGASYNADVPLFIESQSKASEFPTSKLAGLKG